MALVTCIEKQSGVLQDCGIKPQSYRPPCTVYYEQWNIHFILFLRERRDFDHL